MSNQILSNKQQRLYALLILLHGFQIDQPVIKLIKTNQSYQTSDKGCMQCTSCCKVFRLINKYDVQSNPIKQATKAACTTHPATRSSVQSTSTMPNQLLSKKRQRLHALLTLRQGLQYDDAGQKSYVLVMTAQEKCVARGIADGVPGP